MGEFADYAVDEAFQNEAWIADNLPEGRLPDPDFAWGCYDLNSLGQYTQQLWAMFEGAHLGPFEKYRSLGSCIAAKDSLSTEERKHVAALCSKYERSWSMRLGMAKTVLQGRSLSPKQTSWMETNWKGGTSKFLLDMEAHGTKIVALLERMNKLIQEGKGL